MNDRGNTLDVRIIQSAVRFVKKRWSMLLAGVLLLVAAGIVLSGIYMVPTNQTGALFRFGELIDSHVKAGIHFRFPVSIDKITTMNTTEVRRYVTSEKLQRNLDIVTGDENLIEMDLAVQYQIRDYGSYLLDVEDWKKLMSLALESSLTEQVAKMTVDSVLTTGKNRIQVNIRGHLQKTLDAYGDAITVVSTRITRLNPPMEVADSFRQVSDARSDQAKRISEAQSQGNSRLSKARGKVTQILEQARSSHEEILKKASGDAERFSQILKEHQNTEEVAHSEFFYPRVASALRSARVIMVDPENPIDFNLSDTTDQMSDTDY